MLLSGAEDARNLLEGSELTWSERELDLQGRVWHPPKGRTKNSRAHDIRLSNQALAIIEHNIDVVFLDKGGEPFARVWPPRMGSTAAVRRRQLEAAAGPEGLALARDWVAAKLRHQAEFLEELYGRRPDRADLFQAPLAALRASQAELARLEGTLDDQRGRLMGLERKS